MDKNIKAQLPRRTTIGSVYNDLKQELIPPYASPEQTSRIIGAELRGKARDMADEAREGAKRAKFTRQIKAEQREKLNARTRVIRGVLLGVAGLTLTVYCFHSGIISFPHLLPTNPDILIATPTPTPTPGVEGNSGPNPIYALLTLFAVGFLINRGRNFLSSFNKEPPQS
jgi:hypothetical protein